MTKRNNTQKRGNLPTGELRLEGGYQSSAQSLGFNPVSAIDTTAAEKERLRQIERDERTKAQALQTQQGLDRGTLQGQQQYERAVQSFDQAGEKGKLALVKGLVDFSTTAAQTYTKWAEEKEAEDQKQRELDQASSWLDGAGEVLSPDDNGGLTATPNPDAQTDGSEAATQTSTDKNVQVDAIEGAVVDATPDPELQERLREPSANQQAIANIAKGNVYTAATNIGAALGDFLDSDAKVRLPNGNIVSANAASSREELAAISLAFVKSYAAANGLVSTGESQEAFVRTFLPQAQNAIASQVSQRAANIRDSNQNLRIDTANTTAFGSLEAGGSIQDAWTTLATSYFGSGKYGGDRTKANDAAVTAILDYLVQKGDISGIEQLADTPKFTTAEGNPGPKIGTTYATLIAKAKNQAGRVKAGNRRDADEEARQTLEDANNSFITSLIDAKTPEEIEAAHTQYEETLRGLGTPEATTEWLKQRNIPNTRNPLAYGDMLDQATSGGGLSNKSINEAVGSGLISIEQGNQLKQINGAGLEAETAALKPVQPTVKAITDAAANAALANSQVPPEALKSASTAIASDLKTRLNSYLAGLLKSEPEMSAGQLTEAAQNWTNNNAQKLLQNISWDSETYSVKGYTYAGTTSTTTAAKTFDNPATGKKAVVLTGLSVDQMSRLQFDDNLKNDIDVTNDRVLNTQEMTDSLTAIMNGDIDGIPTRVKSIARLLEVTPQYLIAQQAKAQGLPNATEIGKNVTYNPDNPNISSVEQQALNVIGKYESDGAGSYNAVNQGGSDGGNTVLGYSGHYAKLGGRDLTDLSIAEIMELQREDGRSWDSWFASGKLHAVGRYQFIGPTLANIVGAMGISGSSQFTPELQDQMALWLLRNAGNGIGQWVGPNNYATPAERDVVNQARNNVIAANRILRNPKRTQAQTRRAVKDISTAGGLFA